MKSRRIFLLGVILAILLPATAQIIDAEKVLKAETKATDDGWRFGGVTNLNFSQLYLSNWVAGGQSSYALNGLASVFGSYKKIP